MEKERIENIRSLLTYMVVDLDFSDELFQFLFVDVGKSANQLAQQLFETEDRRIAIYGPRGVGKSALLHGIAYSGIANGAPKLPVLTKLSEAGSVGSVGDLEERFHTAIVKGILNIPNIQERWKKLRNSDLAKSYAPWVVQSILAVASVYIQPLSLATGIVTDTVKSIAKSSSVRSLDELLASTDVKVARLSDVLVRKLMDQGIEPVFIIDDLDKVLDKDLVHNFIEGNQAWFEGKNAILTISYNVGESLQTVTTESVSRIATVQEYSGVRSTSECKEIIYNRAKLANSSRNLGATEQRITDSVNDILPESAIAEIIERTFPNPFRMLRLTYQLLDQASREEKSVQEVLEEGPQKVTIRVTKNRLKLLDLVSKRPFSLSELHEQTGTDSRQLYTSLKLMVKQGLLQSTKTGKRVDYHLTESGYSILHEQ